ncbi:MAG: hypothetical protein JXB48_00200 [Candidatus Latescibacteria bacterium]|nr:hypothetical protein [Candidatus Latescibacterota bacterium]
MRFTKLSTVILAVFFTVFFSATVFSADEDPITVGSILKAADCPLTEAQQKAIAELKPGENMREVSQQIYGMFDEKQEAALKAKLGVMPSRNDRPERPRSLFQLIVLEKEGVPLTEKQVSDIKNLSMDQGGYRQMNELLTDAQREAYSKYRGNRGGGNR